MTSPRMTPLTNTPKPEGPIDSVRELGFIVDHLTQTWYGFDKVNGPELLGKIWEGSLHATRNLCNVNVVDDCMDWSPKTKVCIEGTLDADKFLLYLMMASLRFPQKLKENMDFDKNVSALVAQVSVPDASSLKPKGWESFEENKKSHRKGKGINFKPHQFKGFESENHVHYGFEIHTSLPWVMKANDENDRSPFKTLVGAMMQHAGSLNEHNNDIALTQEWRGFRQRLDACCNAATSNNETREINFDFTHPLAQAMGEMVAGRTPMLKSQAAHQALEDDSTDNSINTSSPQRAAKRKTKP